jgi:hypothetical protein
VGQPHRQPGLAQEQLEEAGVVGALGADALDHQQLLEAAGPSPRQEHLGHPAAREGAHQLVAAHLAWHRARVYPAG